MPSQHWAAMTTSTMPAQRPDEVWAGTRISLDVMMPDGGAVEADIWIEVSSGEMRLMEVRPDGSTLDSFSDSLWNAIANPVEGEPYRPGQIVVDRPDLAKALANFSRFQKIEIEVDPELAEQFTQLREDLEAQFRGEGDDFTYLGHGDVEADAVERFFAASSAFFGYQPWEVAEQTPWLEIEGLTPSPVYLKSVGDENSPGALLCWDLSTAEKITRGHLGTALDSDCLSLSLLEPDEIGDELREEIESNDWPVTTLGVPLLTRPQSSEREAPLPSELALMTSLLELLPNYFKTVGEQARETTLSTASGTSVTLRPAAGNFEASEEEHLENVLHELDELETKKQWALACALALTFQEEHKLLDERLLMKITLYLHMLGSAKSLEEFTEAVSLEAPAAWPYVHAWSGRFQGESVFRDRLAQALAFNPGVAKALVEGTESPEDPFFRSWAAVWRAEPSAMEALEGLLKP